MSQIPLVSIVVPVYNKEQYLEECLNSLFAQDYANLEFIFVDDCSTDGSLAKLEQLKVANSSLNITIHHNEQNLHVSNTRNIGLGLAHGKYIFFSDADDIAEKDLISSCVGLAEKEQSDFVCFGLDTENENSEFIEYWLKDELLQAKTIDELRENAFLFLASASAKLVRAEFLQKHKLYFKDIRIAEDKIWTIECVLHASKISFCNKLFYHYKFYSDSLFHKFTKAHLTYLFSLQQNLQEICTPYRQQYPKLLQDYKEYFRTAFEYAINLYLNALEDKNCILEVTEADFKDFSKRFNSLLEQALAEYPWYEKQKMYKFFPKSTRLRNSLKNRYVSYHRLLRMQSCLVLGREA